MAKINPKTGWVAAPTSQPKPVRPGSPTGSSGQVQVADSGKVNTFTSVDAKGKK